ncbi:uncharacterized protein LOC117303456 [Asterias rubens]|uniref:uncharacterized protein LOC117303456 n=1 Tax=Asterias rubens TaxID=7604 RepID=UPI00145594F9|nr:uncharacterized protein LOC117303456 [Asterias rubens]
MASTNMAKITARSSVGSRVPGAANSALKVKSRKEEDKIKVVLSQQLRENMTRLLEVGTFADLSLIINSKKVPVHRHLLQSRLEPFFSSIVEPRMSSGKDGEEVVADLSTLGVSVVELKYLLRAIYAEDDVTPFWVVFQEAIKSHDSNEPIECETVRTDCNGDPTPVAEQCADSLHLERLENALHSECQTTRDRQQPEETECCVETNDATTGSQTVGSSMLSVQDCQYATLQSMGPKSACEPSTTVQNSKDKCEPQTLAKENHGATAEPKMVCEPSATVQNSQNAMLNSGEPKSKCEPGTSAQENHGATAELKMVCEPSATVQNSQSAMLNSGEPKSKCEPGTSAQENHTTTAEPKVASGLTAVVQNKHGASLQQVEIKDENKPGTTLPKTEDTGLTNDTSSLESVARPNETVGESDKSNGEPKTPDEDELLPTACQLGRDLLRIFQGDAGHDVTLKVDGKNILAHRFILCARSEYFSAMLAGSWKESSSSEIEILGFSYSAVMVALQWIYGGLYELPDHGVVLKDLLFLADMYGLENLTEVIDFKLRKDYCHFFHKPCSICLARVPECFALFSTVQLSDLENCVVSWLVQYLSKAWMERSFAALPQKFLFQCRDFAVESFSPSSATPLLLQIDKLICNLPHIKWASPVRTMALQLQSTCRQYMACNFLSILGEPLFQEQLRGMNWKKDVVEPVFALVVPALTPDTANGTFMAVRFFNQGVTDEENADGWNPDAVTLVKELYVQFYSYMVSNASLVAQGPGWSNLPSDLRESIKKEAVFIDNRGKIRARKPVLTSSLKGKSRSKATSLQKF